jgi:chromosome partitioning protein
VKRENGDYVGAFPVYGYMKSGEDKNRLVIDEYPAGIVRDIFRMKLETYTGTLRQGRKGTLNYKIKDIIEKPESEWIRAENAHEAIISTVRGERESAGLWPERTIKAILSDKVYIGDMAQGKTRKVNHTQIAVPEREWVCVPATHEAIISREIYDAVQRKLAENAARYRAAHTGVEPYTPNMFHGKVRCEHCGRAMHRHRNNKTGEYWFRCQTQQNYAKDACTVVSAREDDVLEAALSAFKAHNNQIIAFALRLQKKAPQIREKQAYEDAELTQIKASLARDTGFKQSLYENLVSGAITAADSVIIPVAPKYLDALGLELLLKSVAQIRRQINPSLVIDGILLTMVDRRSRLTREVIGTIENAYGGNIKIFKEHIPNSVRAAETSSNGASIFAHDPKGKVVTAYTALVGEVLANG